MEGDAEVLERSLSVLERPAGGAVVVRRPRRPLVVWVLVAVLVVLWEASARVGVAEMAARPVRRPGRVNRDASERSDPFGPLHHVHARVQRRQRDQGEQRQREGEGGASPAHASA